MKHLFTILLVGLFIVAPFRMEGVIAYPYPVEYQQPNGEVIVLRMHGDEYFHYITTGEGSLVAYDKPSGYYMYAVIDHGRLVPGLVKVSDTNLRGATSSGFLKSDSKEFLEQIKRPALVRSFEEKVSFTPKLRASSPVTGTRRGLVILANFTDKEFVIPNSNTAFQKMLNQPDYSENEAMGSARDFYMDNSNGRFTPDFDVYGPVNLPHTIAYYGANDDSDNDKNARQMIVDACKSANAEYSNLNFADYDYNKDGVLDNVFVFYAGHNEAESHGLNPDLVWPHKSSVINTNTIIDGVKLADYACTSELRGNTGNVMAGIGTFTHEFGHVLGLPDLYDADQKDNGEGPGVGYWCTMGAGSYLNGGKTPPFFGAMERYLLGWIDPVVIEPSASPVTKTLSPIDSSDNNVVYRLNTPTAEEYFLFEVRKKQSWDTYLNGEGMLVFHVDRTTTSDKTVSVYGRTETLSALRLWEYYMIPNIIGTHQCFDLLRANNNPNGEQGNPFPGVSNVTTLSDYSLPGLLSWNGRRTYALINNITRDAVTGNVSFVLSKDAATPEVITNPVTEIQQTSARLNATTLEAGITERGFCWNTTGSPVIDDPTVKVSGTASGSFSSGFTGLTSNTKYYVRAYVKTASSQVYYGQVLSFTTLPSPTPIPYAEAFMDGGQGFWSILDGNNDGEIWRFYSQKQTGYTSGAAIVNVGNKEGDDWLITPQLAIPANVKNLTFSFEVIVFNDGVLGIGISDSYTDPSSFEMWSPLSLEDQFPDPEEGTIRPLSTNSNLDEYLGKNIFIAFIDKSTIESQMWITNFEIKADYPDGIDEVTKVSLPIVYVQDRTAYFKNVSGAAEAEIFDATGKLHYRISVSDGMSQYIAEPGIYIVKLKNGNQTYNYKLIVR